MKHFLRLTKFGIVCFVIFTACGGYFMGLPISHQFPLVDFAIFLVGLYCLSSGSFALNQYQEREIDQLMPRTRTRPLPNGEMTPQQVVYIAVALLTVGSGLCFLTHWKVGILGLVTVFFYNYLYTKVWKRNMAFAAVPGAIPGAMPFVLGYTAASGLVFTLENLYFFAIMFFWQMPHYWVLAMRYKEDYSAARIPVLPAVRGDHFTMYYIGLYMFAYLALVFGAPFFAPVGWAYLILALPFAFKVLWEFFRFVNESQQKRWLPFFLWTTFSILVFILVPAIDRWTPWLL